MNDKIVASFLNRQVQEGLELAEASDLVELLPLDGPPPQHYLLRLFCNGLVKRRNGEITQANHFEVGIYFSPAYLRSVNPAEVLTWFGPLDVYHPNIAPPFICIGEITPGTSLIDLMHRIYDVITYQKVTPHEGNALNREACAWARSNWQRFPIDGRPLKRRVLEIRAEPT